MSRFPRWLMAIAGLVVAVVLIGGTWVYRAHQHSMRHQVEAQLDAIAQLKVNQISQWRIERLGDATVLTESPFFSEGVMQWLAEPTDESADRILIQFRSLQKKYRYRDILLVDVGGQVLLSLGGRSGSLQGESARVMAAAFREAIPTGTDIHAGVSDMPIHIDTIVPIFDVIAPLFVKKGESLQPIGAVILQDDARQFLYPLIQSWPMPSHSAEALVVRRDGDEVLFLNDLRHQPETALKLRFPLTRKDLPAVMAVLGREGVVQGKDYRGVDVFAVLKAVPDSPWFMVSKMDASEALATWRVHSALILALIVGFLAVATGAIGFVWQRTGKAHYRELFESEEARRHSEERYHTTLLSVGDGVIVTDAEGKVELLNPSAENLTKWRNEEACGRRLGEVFRVINEGTRQPVEDPVSRVVREGLVVGLANHTLLVAKDGTERPIADSGAPIRDDQGNIVGVVLVFRDQTRERASENALRRSEERFRTSLDNMLEGCQIVGFDWRYLYVNDAAAKSGRQSKSDLLGRTMMEKYPGSENAEMFAALRHCMEKRTPQHLENEFTYPDGEKAWFELRIEPVPEGVFVLSLDITARKQAEEERGKLEAQLLQAQKMESVGRLAGGVAHDFNNQLTVILAYADMALKVTDPASPLYRDIEEIHQAAQRSADLTSRLLAFARKQIISPKVLDLNETLAGMLTMLRRLIGEDIELVWAPGADLWRVQMDPSQLDQILANLVVNAGDAIADTGTITLETENATLDESYCAEHAGFTPGEYVVLAVSDTGAGISREVLQNVFEPFFTTKDVGKGTGLGLATVYGIVKQNNGFINAYSELGHGTSFKIYLPRFKSDAVEASAEAPSRAPQRGTETVLVVEDEVKILKLCERMLSELGYRALTANAVEEAIRLVGEYAGDIHLLMTDVVMPEMNGRDLAQKLASIKPGMKYLFMSGYTANVIAHRGILDEGVRFLQKPFSMTTLAEKVREAIES